MPLDEYRRKRDFKKTPEPGGGTVASAGGFYCIQHHHARREHYDFRLELDGVLKSWAVPKGPSLDPHEKRLAVHVEDHPLEYGSFEGAIPAGEYGAGDVLLWDVGRWEPIGDAHAGYRAGKLKFTLRGEKLRGGWMLARMGGRAGEGGKNWLLLKERDAEAKPATDGDVLRERPESVHGLHRGPLPERVALQLATPAAAAPEGDGWLHEIKYDGYRALCRIAGGTARLFTRSGQDWTARFHGVGDAAAALPVDGAFLDGEIVVLGEDGRSRFEALQEALAGNEPAPLTYVVFDLLFEDGVDLREQPLERRKARLAALLRRATDAGVLRYGDHVVGRGPAFLREACAHGLEGIVAKRRDAPWRAGRTTDWLKVRCGQRQEVVVGGFTDPGGARGGLGALLVGVHDGGGRLVYAGRVGTGFSMAGLDRLRAQLGAIERATSPFAPFDDVPPATYWVEPTLVAEVGFTNWTRDGRLRHPVFVGLREDKPASEVVREAASAAAPAAPPPRGRRPDEPTTVAGVRLTHPDRALWPEVGVTKLELAHYYVAVADWILPHVAGRPLSLVRGPRGWNGTTFFQKHRADGLPDAIRTVDVAGEEDAGPVAHVMIEDTAGLVGLVQVDTLELHVWGARADRVERPDRVVFDLDPDEALPWAAVVAAARAVRLRLETLGLDSVVKTTGGKGLHVVVPLERRHGWGLVKAFARAVAVDVAKRLPDHFTANAAKADRRGRVYLDWLRNTRGATAVAAFSARARAGAPVSMPLGWDELDAVVPASLTVRTVPPRLAALAADPWASVATSRQRLGATVRRVLHLSDLD
ncbi:MAG: DNA ligase D [bacterium]|nr:DNA ligase D [bacterium]